MKRKYFLLLVLCVTFPLLIICISFKPDGSKKLRTDGYYYTYDTLRNSTTGEEIVRFWPMFLFDDNTISDLYYHDTMNEFEDYILKKSYKWVKKFSKFGDYSISNDSIYIHLKTYQNKWPDSGTGSVTDNYMKGLVLNDSTFEIVENIFLGDTMKFYGDFKFYFSKFQLKK